MRRWASLLLIAAMLASASAPVASGDVLEGFDEDKAPAAADPPAPPPPSTPWPAGAGGEQRRQRSPQAAAAQSTQQQRAASPLPSFGPFEIGAASVLLLYVINVLWGRALNARLAHAWNEAYAQPGGIFDKNFSSIGIGQEMLARESGDIFKFYASGRRHVQGLLATLKLHARQDLLSVLWSVISPAEDTITLEALMAEASMPPIVLAVGTPKVMRRLSTAHNDIDKFTKKIQAPRDVVPNWPNDKLHIYAEHSTTFAEVFADPRVLSTLSPNGPHARAFKHFRSLHFSNEYAEGTHKRVLRFTFALPPAGSMEHIAPLMALVPLFIDLVGTYKPSPELRRKAEAARQKAAEDQGAEQRKARLEALAQRKHEKALEEKAKLARLPPAERQKVEDKLQKKAMEKQMRKRAVRIG